MGAKIKVIYKKYGRNMTFLEAIKSGFFRWSDFSTRSSRSEYWFWALFNVLANLCFAILVKLPVFGGLVMYFNWIFGILMFIPSLALAIRRLHDVGRSGFWMLINFIPLIGNLVYLYWMVRKGDDKPNNWGKNPLL